jgi:hypothetical protein
MEVGGQDRGLIMEVGMRLRRARQCNRYALEAREAV